MTGPVARTSRPPDEGAGLLAERLRTLVRVRWGVIAFGLLHVFTYATLPYPPGVRRASLTVVAVAAVANVAVGVVVPRLPAHLLPGAALVTVAGDLLALGAIVLLFAFDPVSAIFTLLVLVPIEAALLFGLPGAMWAWLATAVVYVAREWYGIRHGNPWELDSLTFRLGLLATVAIAVGLLARDLQSQRQAAADALAEARRADAWRSRLVTMLAHDLRSPLAGVRTGLGTLRQHGDGMSAETARTVVDSGIRQVDRMLAMTRDLLDLARAEDGRLDLDRRPVGLLAVVHRARDLVGLPEGELDVDVPADLRLVADPDRLEQVVANLLTNAVRHGRPPVQVSARTVGDRVRLDVRDHGPGVPEALRDRVFEPFASTDDGTHGVGLGAWVVAHLVHLHGGEVFHEHAHPGARFVVLLPRGDVSSEGAPPSSVATSRA